MGKYDPLREYLAATSPDVAAVTLSFGEIDRLVGASPPSARTPRTWWANNSQSQSRAWRGAGWHVVAGGVDLAAERVTFGRGAVGGTHARRRGLEPPLVSEGAGTSQDRPPGERPGLVFISHSREDRDYVVRLAELLTERGLRPWVDDHIATGSSWRHAIRQALTDASVVVVVMTPAADESPWVEREVHLAEHLGLPIAPLLLRGPAWWWLANVQYEDVTHGGLPGRDYVDRLVLLANSDAGTGPGEQHIERSGGTGKPPPDDHLGTSVTTWRGVLPAAQLPALEAALKGRERPARWQFVADVENDEATVLVTMHVYWRQASHGSVTSHILLVHRELVGRIEAKTGARFHAVPMATEFVYA